MKRIVASLCGLLLCLIVIIYSRQGSKDEEPPSGEAAQSLSNLNSMNALRAVFVTCPNIEVAKKLSHGLVSKKLAACVNIIPSVTSVYEWEGKINEDSELILMIKTQSDLFEDLTKFVKENHPYDVPEVIALNIEQGNSDYLNWIREVTQKKSQ